MLKLLKAHEVSFLDKVTLQHWPKHSVQAWRKHAKLHRSGVKGFSDPPDPVTPSQCVLGLIDPCRTQ